jgi:hypothetical protein
VLSLRPWGLSATAILRGVSVCPGRERLWVGGG